MRAYAADMTSHGNGHLIYLAATAGQVEQLEALLQDLLPVANKPQDAYECLQDINKGTHPTMADYLEYVDKQTGLTPLLTAVFHHREPCAKLLLEYGADVHHHGAGSYQTPLRMAVTQLDMNVDMVDLLVSYGASPFLEAEDGETPMDEVVRLRHHRIGPMPHDLGSVLLCLRRRCPFRGHLELKVDRYLGLSQTWRKFFCVLSPREKVPGCPVDMQLLIFSKNGFDPVTSIWMTNAAPIEVPLKAAHGRACYELALPNRQQKKPGKLFAPGSPRAGFSIFVRALSKDPVEASWLRRFINLATSEPSMAMLNGDSEPPLFFRPSLKKSASPAADKSSPQLQPDPPQPGSSKHCSVSFSSDSAHVPVPQAPIAPNTPAQTHSTALVVSPQQTPSISPIALPNGIPAQVSAFPSTSHSSTLQTQETPNGHEAAWESAGQGGSGNGSRAPYQSGSQATRGSGRQSSSFSSSLTAAQQQPSSDATSQVASSASPAPTSSTQVWRSNPAYGVPPTPTPTSTTTNDRTPSSHRASQSLPSLKSFTSVDRRLTDSWRAKLLEDLADESDSEQGVDMRMTLPVVSEHDSLPALTQQWGLQSVEITQDLQSLLHHAPEPSQHAYDSSAQTDAPAEKDLSSSALLWAHAHPSHAASFPNAATYVASHVAQAAPPSHNLHPSDVLASQHGFQYHLRQPQQHDQADRAKALHPQDMTQAQAAADDSGERGAYNMVPPAMSPISLLSDSNLEVVKARSNMLDIPSAELLDSILDFANAVCGEQQHEGAYSPLKDAHEDTWAHAEARARSEPAERRPANFCNVSMTESIEPFSDDDEVTILDTTEVKKLSPEGLQPLPEVALPPPGLPRQVMISHHFDSRDEDLVHETQRAALHDAPFHHYSHSPHLIQQNSPNAAARYGHMNRMYDTSTSDVSSHGAGPSANQAAKQSMRGMSLSPQPELEYGGQHQNSIYDSSGSHSMVDPDYQLYHDVIEQSELLPQMEPSEFREMIDGIMAHSEQQAAQVHMTGGAASSTSALHPIWEDEETCLEGHQSPCIATIGVPVS